MQCVSQKVNRMLREVTTLLSVRLEVFVFTSDVDCNRSDHAPVVFTAVFSCWFKTVDAVKLLCGTLQDSLRTITRTSIQQRQENVKMFHGYRYQALSYNNKNNTNLSLRDQTITRSSADADKPARHD